MVANRAELEFEHSPASLILDSVKLMESVAAHGEWQRATNLAMQLKRAILDIPERDRAALIHGVNKSIERVRTMALSSRIEVTDKLTELRRGQVATRAYGQPETTSGLR